MAGFNIGLLALLCAACTSMAVDARAFEATRWHVSAINGRATPAASNYRVEFQRGRIGGQFGCNHFGGEYRVRSDVLITNAMAMTMMGCPDPAATFEAQGLAVLQQPMRMNWTDARHLTLSNGAGSIALEGVPYLLGRDLRWALNPLESSRMFALTKHCFRRPFNRSKSGRNRQQTKSYFAMV